jgi:hypothetical protein
MYNSVNRFHALAELLNMGLRSNAMSSTDLAKKVKIEKVEDSTIIRTVRKIVSGERLPPKKDSSTYLDHFAKALKISFNELEKAYEKDINQSKQELSVSDLVGILASSHDVDYNEKNPVTNIWKSEKKLTIALKTKEDLRMAMISMLENLEELEGDQLTIYLTYQGKKSVFSSNCIDGIGMEDRWSSAIESTIKKGYKFVHLIRMGSDQFRIQEIVLRIVSFIGEQKGTYELRTFQESIILQPSYGMFVVPYKDHTEAIMSFSASESEMNDGGILTRDVDIVDLTKKHVKIIEAQSKQVFQRFDNYSKMFEKISAADQKPGKRYVFLKRLSEITRPLEWYSLDSNWAKQLCEHIGLSNEEDRKNHIEQRLKRRLYLEEHLRQYPCYYIYSKSIFMRDLITSNSNKELSEKFKSSKDHYFIPNDVERKEQLDSILKLLLTKNFYIGLIDDDENNGAVKEYFNSIKLNFCEVNDENLVFMEVPVNINNHTKYQNRWYFTQDRTVARSFQTYFSNLWDTIPENQKDINVIYEELSSLKDRFSDLLI